MRGLSLARVDRCRRLSARQRVLSDRRRDRRQRRRRVLRHFRLASGERSESLLIISPVTRRAVTCPLVLELIFFLSNNVRVSTATEMCPRDHNRNNCTHSGNVCYCMYMVNNDYDKFRSFSRLYMTLFRHRTCTYLHGRADRFLVSVSNGQVAALSDRAYYQ